jgi:hypothetical protein
MLQIMFNKKTNATKNSLIEINCNLVFTSEDHNTVVKSLETQTSLKTENITQNKLEKIQAINYVYATQIAANPYIVAVAIVFPCLCAAFLILNDILSLTRSILNRRKRDNDANTFPYKSVARKYLSQT